MFSVIMILFFFSLISPFGIAPLLRISPENSFHNTSAIQPMDFIAQEMNREANTTLSKANDIEISNAAIDLKTEIEKVREQIQNIE